MRPNARHHGLKLFGSVNHAQPARTLREDQTLRRLGVTGDVDFRRGAIRREERRVELSFFDSIIFTVEIHFAVSSPEGITDG